MAQRRCSSGFTPCKSPLFPRTPHQELHSVTGGLNINSMLTQSLPLRSAMAQRRDRARSTNTMSSIPPENLLMGVPKKGRLHEQCMKLLVQGAGLEHKRPERLDIAHCTDLPVGT
eukprot:613801-Hanusia_phi.AAC.1